MPVGLRQIAIGVFTLGIFVQVLHVRVGRRAVDVEVIFLDVFAVVAFAVGKSKHAFLQDGVATVPESNRETKLLLVVGEPGQPVFAPTVGARPGLIVGEVIPGISVLAVVLPYRAPLPLAQVRPPLFPRDATLTGLIKPLLFCDLDIRERCTWWGAFWCHGKYPFASRSRRSIGTKTTHTGSNIREICPIAANSPVAGFT